MRYFVTGHEMLLYLSGDREEHKEECCFELLDFESKEEAVAAAREFIKEHKNAVNDQKHGIGSVTYWTAASRMRTSGGFLATRTAPRRMVTVSSRQMRPPNTSARWMGAGRSVHSSVRNTATTISLITKMTAIRRFQAT